MNLIDVTAQVSAVITLIALCWLAMRAFHRHAGWGLAVLLFSPLGAAVFGRRYWKDVKKPLTVYAVAFLVTLGLTLYMFNAWGGWELLRTGVRVQQGMQSDKLASRDASNFLKANLAFAQKSGLDIRNIPAAEFAREQLVREALEAMRQAEDAEAAEAEEVEEVPYHDMRKKVKSQNTGYRVTYIPIDVSEAHKYIGATVKVTRKNVVEKEYRLTGATKSRLQFAQRNRSGNFSFSFRSRDIEKLRVLVKQPK
ncbi:MAG: hypothetical protein WBQ78_10925 [Gammaproteobacteria bacterium]